MGTSCDFTPFFRSSVGFDCVFNLLECAVADFSQDELKPTYAPNLLTVGGTRAGDDKANYVYRSIAGGTSGRRFELADFVKVANAHVENGSLSITLKRELPEGVKPRNIAAGTETSAHLKAELVQIEQKRAARRAAPT